VSDSLPIYGGILTFDKAEHAYQWDGKFVPGVTSILRVLDKPALVQWAANMCAEMLRDHPERIRATPTEWEAICKEAKTAHRRASKAAADIGTEVHRFAEAFLSGERIDLPEDPRARNGALAFKDWHHAHDVRPLATERRVFSKRWWFCGTTDFIGQIDGTPCILDFKTSSGLYPEMVLQLAAYAIAIEEELGNDARFDDGWIIRLDKKTGKFEPYHIPLKDGYRDAFLRVKEAYELLNKLNEDINGLRKQAA
jgi:hypothetical protein